MEPIRADELQRSELIFKDQDGHRHLEETCRSRDMEENSEQTSDGDE